jgi:uncharacterized protein YdaU (DUF1376 family)
MAPGIESTIMSNYEPKYLCWHEKDFAADPYVSRVMRSLDRHFYRALIIASYFNSLRPYLPNDDAQLWILADAESLEQWLAHKDVVMHKFQLCPANDNLWEHKRILADWQLHLDAQQKRVDAGRLGGKQKASNAKQEPSSALAPVGTALAPSTNKNKHEIELNEKENNNNKDAAAVSFFLEEKHSADIGSWGNKYRAQMLAWITQHGEAFMDEAITEAKSEGFSGVTSPIAIMVTTYLPKAIGKLIAKREQAEQTKKEAACIKDSIERQTQELVAARFSRVLAAQAATSEVSADDIFGKE